MSYLEQTEYRIEYEIVPTKPYRIIRNCAGCGCKKAFESTDRFRINANGNRLDIWLIYQCTQCGHTYNMPVYERIRAGDLSPEAYRSFQDNDRAAALYYGLRKELLARNKAEMADERIPFEIKQSGMSLYDQINAGHSVRLIINNPYHMKLRTEKVVAEILKISGSEAKKRLYARMGDACPRFTGSRTELVL